MTKPKIEILRVLSQESMHGYKLAKEIGKHGSTVYTHLNQLEEEGYIRGEESGERRIVYSLTEKGELILRAESMED